MVLCNLWYYAHLRRTYLSHNKNHGVEKPQVLRALNTLHKHLFKKSSLGLFTPYLAFSTKNFLCLPMLRFYPGVARPAARR
jgi:hypothetical protein